MREGIDSDGCVFRELSLGTGVTRGEPAVQSQEVTVGLTIAGQRAGPWGGVWPPVKGAWFGETGMDLRIARANFQIVAELLPWPRSQAGTCNGKD